AGGIVFAWLIAQHAILRKGAYLQVEVRRNTPLDLGEHLRCEQERIADVHMRADRTQAFRDRPVAIGERALEECLERELGLELPPYCDAFQQGTGSIHARQA